MDGLLEWLQIKKPSQGLSMKILVTQMHDVRFQVVDAPKSFHIQQWQEHSPYLVLRHASDDIFTFHIAEDEGMIHVRVVSNVASDPGLGGTGLQHRPRRVPVEGDAPDYDLTEIQRFVDEQVSQIMQITGEFAAN